MAVAAHRGEVVEPLDLLRAQLDAVGGRVLVTLFTYTAEPGSRSEEALKLLGSWAATLDPAEARTSRPSGRSTSTSTAPAN